MTATTEFFGLLTVNIAMEQPFGEIFSTGKLAGQG
jgi:hypothetical protein